MKFRNIVIQLSLFIPFYIVSFSLYSQGRDSLTEKNGIKVRGYIKNLQSYTFDKKYKSFIGGNLIHNRLNLHDTSFSKFNWAIEIRNRLIWSEEIALVPGFEDALKNTNEFLNMSITWISNQELILHTTIDRLWLLYTGKNFEARVGRQRINWGINTIWNPNDIFNTYNILDFDYEERPGRDAIKATYRFAAMSNIELAAARSGERKNNVVAVKYFFNKYNYDFQAIGGLYNSAITLGFGWAGSIKQAGFKGEIQYFAPYQGTCLTNLGIEIDYLLKNSWYINGGLLFNSNGTLKPLKDSFSTAFIFSPKHLMPTKWTSTLIINKQYNPLLNGGFTSIYAPGSNILILIPQLSYNVFSNMDIDLIGQLFFTEQNDTFTGMTHRIFLRAKWSF